MLLIGQIRSSFYVKETKNSIDIKLTRTTRQKSAGKPGYIELKGGIRRRAQLIIFQHHKKPDKSGRKQMTRIPHSALCRRCSANFC